MNKQEIHDYFHNNPQGYWFKAKLYGWGWTPVKWQGWLVISIWLLVVFWIASGVEEGAQAADLLWSFFVPLGLAVATLICLCFIKGERPSWRWGLKSKK